MTTPSMEREGVIDLSEKGLSKFLFYLLSFHTVREHTQMKAAETATEILPAFVVLMKPHFFA